MSEYKEALDELFMWAINGYCALEVGSKKYNYLKETLYELINKSTPKKPLIQIDSEEFYFKIVKCPNCKKDIVLAIKDHQKYCRDCGQGLDWSDDNE